MEEDYEQTEFDKRHFIRFSLRADARQYYILMLEDDRPWGFIITAFNDKYFSTEKKEEISNQLAHLKIEDCRKGEEVDDHKCLDRLIERINELTPMVRPKYRDEEAKVRILRDANMGTEWGLRASARVTYRKSYQSLIYALYESQRDLNLH